MAYKTIGMDRVMEIANTPPGTGAVTLGGAVVGYDSFSGSVIKAADTCAYFIEALAASGNPAGDWERGFGTYNGTTFSRTVVTDSSNAGALVNFTTPVRIGSAPMSDTTQMWPAPGGRLTLSPTNPVVDSAGSTTLYYLPYLHDRIPLYTSSNANGVQVVQFSSVSLDLTTVGTTAGTAYDVFGILSSGALKLQLLAWTNPTTRATNLGQFNSGWLCNNSNLSQRYLGSFYCKTANTIVDTASTGSAGASGQRLLWNMYNRVQRPVYMYDNTQNYTYNSSTWRIMRGSTYPNGGVEMFRGINEDLVFAAGVLSANMGNLTGIYAGIGVNNAIPGFPSSVPGFYINNTAANNQWCTATPFYADCPGLGYTVLSLMEKTNSNTTVTFNPATGYAFSGLDALVYC